MGSRDRKHFESYRLQTQVKHQILEKYLNVYFHILMNRHSSLMYIDGFSGPGKYRSGSRAIDGSPLRILNLIASSDKFSPAVSTMFIEDDRALFKELESNIESFYTQHPHIHQPVTTLGKFADVMDSFLNQFRFSNRLGPAFLFIDPCGVAGTDFDIIRRFLQHRYTEAMIFFNIDGVRRILGLNDPAGNTLTQILGSKQRAHDLVLHVQKETTPIGKEQRIIDYYKWLLAEFTPAKYVSAFRVEYEDRRTVSHYFLHATSHHLGFAKMKDVMWSEASRFSGNGGFGLEQASNQDQLHYIPLFDPLMTQLRSEIIDVLRQRGTTKTDYFFKNLPETKDNPWCEKAYKSMLITMEEDKTLEVMSKTNPQVKAKSPRIRNGKNTLGKGYYVRLR